MRQLVKHCVTSVYHHFGKMVSLEPVIQQAVEPKTKADQEKMSMGLALNRLAQEDPSFRVKLTKNLVKQLSAVWVSCTWKLSLTV